MHLVNGHCKIILQISYIVMLSHFIITCRLSLSLLEFTMVFAWTLLKAEETTLSYMFLMLTFKLLVPGIGDKKVMWLKSKIRWENVQFESVVTFLILGRDNVVRVGPFPQQDHWKDSTTKQQASWCLFLNSSSWTVLVSQFVYLFLFRIFLLYRILWKSWM